MSDRGLGDMASGRAGLRVPLEWFEWGCLIGKVRLG